MFAEEHHDGIANGMNIDDTADGGEAFEPIQSQ